MAHGVDLDPSSDVLAYFDRPGTSDGPAETLNGRREHLSGPAIGFRNLINHIARLLVETGGFSPDPPSGFVMSVLGV